jgi:hypothetical protein
MKYAFLTGAGASFGAGRLVPRVPPLGKGLYNELAKKYPTTWGNLPWEYAGSLRGEFELGMQKIWEKRLELVQRFMIDMACYFSEFGPSSDRSDCYSKIAAVIAEKNMEGLVAFATLNYECTMDVAACRAGIKIAYAGFPPPEDNLVIWKLHGACNLIPDVKVDKMTIVAKSILDGPIKAVDLPLVRKQYQEDNLAIPPAMCVYMPGKPTQTAPRFVAQVRQEWARWMEGTDIVTIIGVRPNLAESYVWKPIMDSHAEVWYVGGEDGEYLQLKNSMGNRFKHVAYTFDTGIKIVLDELKKT